jgi:hypothetical protein
MYFFQNKFRSTSISPGGACDRAEREPGSGRNMQGVEWPVCKQTKLPWLLFFWFSRNPRPLHDAHKPRVFPDAVGRKGKFFQRTKRDIIFLQGLLKKREGRLLLAQCQVYACYQTLGNKSLTGQFVHFCYRLLGHSYVA